MPTTESSVPPASRLTGPLAQVLGTTNTMARNVTNATTAATTKTDPHQNCSSSAPEASSPRVPPLMAKPTQIPTARARCAGGKTLVMVDSVPGMMRAEPTPITAR
jgi:hypothetical protein